MGLSSFAARAAESPAAARLFLRVARKEASLVEALAGGLATRRATASFRRIIGALANVRRVAGYVDECRAFAPEVPVPRTGPSSLFSFQRVRVENLTFIYPLL